MENENKSELQAVAGLISVITSIKPKLLGKQYSLEPTGLQAETSAQITSANVETVKFNNATEFREILMGLGPNQAISNSTMVDGSLSGRICTLDKLAENPGFIARTPEYMNFADAPGIMTIDYDPDGTPLERADLLKKLVQVCPQLQRAMHLWWASSSSQIFVNETEYKGISGQRVYILVKDARDIPRCGAALQKRLWLAGYGRIKISKSGQLLLRTIADAAMFEPARLDFAGGAVCSPPLEQRRSKPEIYGGEEWLDTRSALPDLNAEEMQTYLSMIEQAKSAAEPKSEEIRKAWVNARIDAETEKQVKKGVERDVAESNAKKCLEDAVNKELTGDFTITLETGVQVTIDHILENVDKYDGLRTLDPLEPEYRNSDPIGKLLLKRAMPTLNSFAHGGVKYILRKSCPRIVLAHGKINEYMTTIGTLLRKQSDVFFYAGSLVQMTDRGHVTLTKYSLPVYLGKIAAFYKYNIKGAVQVTDFGIQQSEILLSTLHNKDFIEIASIADIASVDKSGKIIDRPGHHEESGVYFCLENMPEESKKYNVKDENQIISALQTLWKAWSEYAYQTEHDRAAMLAAILSAVMRPMLPTMPGYIFDAPVQGSGKSLAASALHALATGSARSGMRSLSGTCSDVELQKELLALSAGGLKALCIDNLASHLSSSVLASRITTDGMSGRMLGQTKWLEFSSRVLFTITSNNGTLSKDLQRRFCRIRIDTGLENPNSRSFAFSPSDVAVRNRQDIAWSAAFVIAACIASNENQYPSADCGFSEWNKYVRRTVLWLGKTGLAEQAGIGHLGDPAKSILHETGGDDPKVISSRNLVTAIATLFGADTFLAEDIKMICEIVDRDRRGNVPEIPKENATIYDSIKALTNNKSAELTSVSVGMLLRALKDTIYDKMALKNAGCNSNKTTQWRVVHVPQS